MVVLQLEGRDTGRKPLDFFRRHLCKRARS
jgi:hypothetical protein